MSVFKQVLDLQKESSFTAIYITNRKEGKNRSMCLLCHHWSEITADYHLTVDYGIKFLSVLNQLWVINTRTIDDQIGCMNEGKPPGVFGINGKSQHLAALVMSSVPPPTPPRRVRAVNAQTGWGGSTCTVVFRASETFNLVWTENCFIHFEILEGFLCLNGCFLLCFVLFSM